MDFGEPGQRAPVAARPFAQDRRIRPRTNGKAERFLQTVMRECAYARAFRSSQQRAAALPRWLHVYNVHRPHTALAGQPPITRLTMNNLLGHES
jgi:transposase InsO family protein